MKNIFKKLKFIGLGIVIASALTGGLAFADSNINYWQSVAGNNLNTNTPGGPATANIHVGGCYIGLGTSTPCGGGGGGGGTIGAPVIGGNPNSILYVGASGNLSDDSSYVYLANNKQMGVGIASPNFTLDVQGLGTGNYGGTQFFGTGLNDLTFVGTPNLHEAVTFQPHIDSTKNATITYTNSGPAFQIGEIVTGSISGTTATIATDNGSTMTVQNGSSVIWNPSDVLTGNLSGASGNLTGYSITADTFRWLKNGTTIAIFVPITGGVQNLQNGVQVQWASTTGQTKAV